MVLYVDDCWMADTGGAQAGNDLRMFCDRFKLTLQDKPKQLLGMNVDMGDDGSVKISASADVKAKAETYLPKPLGKHPLYGTPSTPQLVTDYEIVARKEHYVDLTFQKSYQSKVGALIYSPPCGRPGETFAIGILARALTFPTAAMDEHANRVLAYMAQNAHETIEYKARGGAQLIAYSDSDWAVMHSTTGFYITYGGAAVSYGSKHQHCISLSSTEPEIVAASHTAAEVVYLRGLLAEMGREEGAPHPCCTWTTPELFSCPRSDAHANARGMLIAAISR
eukprot:2698317-Pleurochrysis_carterae.AAC.2